MRCGIVNLMAANRFEKKVIDGTTLDQSTTYLYGLDIRSWQEMALQWARYTIANAAALGLSGGGAGAATTMRAFVTSAPIEWLEDRSTSQLAAPNANLRIRWDPTYPHWIQPGGFAFLAIPALADTDEGARISIQSSEWTALVLEIVVPGADLEGLHTWFFGVTRRRS